MEGNSRCDAVRSRQALVHDLVATMEGGRLARSRRIQSHLATTRATRPRHTNLSFARFFGHNLQVQFLGMPQNRERTH